MPPMNALIRNRSRSVLLWIVIASLWLALYPALNLSKREAILSLLSFFFFLGIQKFHEDDLIITEAAEHGLSTDSIRPSRWWGKCRIPLFLCGGLATAALFALHRLFLH